MEPQNAFIGSTVKPTAKQLATTLGASAAAWDQLVQELADQQVNNPVWKYYSPKYGWSLQVKRKERTIVHLSPCTGCFRAAIILGDRAVKAAKAGRLSKKLSNLLAKAPKYPEGTGVRLTIKAAKDLAPLRTLIAVKLAN